MGDAMADFDTIFEEETELAESDYYAVPDSIIIRGDGVTGEQWQSIQY